MGCGFIGAALPLYVVVVGLSVWSPVFPAPFNLSPESLVVATLVVWMVGVVSLAIGLRIPNQQGIPDEWARNANDY